jgi:hypothetical protein
MHKSGERNIHCPYYNSCLDYAVKGYWRSWDCSQCPHRVAQSVIEWECGLEDEDLCYNISPDVVRWTRENGFD